MHPVSFHSIAFSQQLSHMCFTPAKTIACLRYMMSQMILSNWKSHHISWKPWNHRQCEAADSEMIVLTLTHNDAALTHTENSKETFQYWGETHTHSLTQENGRANKNTDTESQQTDKWARAQHLQTLLSFICKWGHSYSVLTALFTQKPKRWSKLPIRLDKMSDEMIGNDREPNDLWQGGTQQGEMSQDDWV